MIKKKPDKPADSGRWLLTYSDLITLLMAFFIIMYAMSNVNTSKYTKLAASMNAAMGNGKNFIDLDSQAAAVDAANAKPVDTIVVPSGGPGGQNNGGNGSSQNTSQTEQKLQSYLNQNGLSGSVSVSNQERGLVVSIQDSFFFDEGKADIKSGVQPQLIGIGKILSKMNNYIVVEGNTDNVPISNGEFKNNWDLASERANNVTLLLIGKSGVQPTKIASRSNGEYRPVADNSTEAERQKNRRVDIVVLDQKFNKSESDAAK